MRIRKAKIKDIPKIADMGVGLMRYHQKLDTYFTPSKNARKKYLEYFKKCVYSRKKILLVTVADSKIIGYALASLASRPPVLKIQKIGTIEDVYFEKKYRGSGIAKIFLENIYIWFKKNNIKDIELSVHAENEIGRKAWKKYGFQEYLLRLKKKI